MKTNTVKFPVMVQVTYGSLSYTSYIHLEFFHLFQVILRKKSQITIDTKPHPHSRTEKHMENYWTVPL